MKNNLIIYSHNSEKNEVSASREISHQEKLIDSAINYFRSCFSEHHKYNINIEKVPKKLLSIRGKLISKFLEKESNLDLKNANILDLGCGWGDISSYFVNKSKNVVGFDVTPNTLKEIKCKEIKNLNLVRGDAEKLPFKDSFFDVVILCGVLEWVALDKKGNVKKIQLKVLKEINRILTKGGILYLGIENRFGLNALLGGPEHHTGLPFVSILPRKLADIYSRLVHGEKYRMHTYSKGELEKMLISTGFYSEFYTAIPTYGYPKIYAKLNKKGLIKVLKEIPNLKYPGYKGKIVSKIGIILTFFGIFKELPFNWVILGKKFGPPNCFIKHSKKKEYHILKKLSKKDIRTPEPYYFDDKLGILSMEMCKGKEFSHILRSPKMSKADKKRVIRETAKWLGKLHLLTAKEKKIPANSLEKIIEKYSGSNVNNYEKEFYKKDLDLIASKKNIICQIHGDFNAKNVMVRNNKNIFIVDFESSEYGLPLIDVYNFIITLDVVSSLNPFLSSNFKKEISNIFLKTYFNTTKFEFPENFKKIVEFHIHRFWYNRCKDVWGKNFWKSKLKDKAVSMFLLHIMKEAEKKFLEVN